MTQLKRNNLRMKTPDFSKSPLIPVIIQDAASLKILMLAYMNYEAYTKTVTEMVTYFYSRSRDRLWKKGETSGHIQLVKKIFFDCDEDTLLIQVEQKGGAACHEGYNSCFFRELQNDSLKIVAEKVFDPEKVYS